MKSLVGYTGFVGSNLASRIDFDCLYNSRNIEEAFGTKPDILYYAGVPAQKFIADKDPGRDLLTIENAALNIERINPKKLVLISTVDVYGEKGAGKDESFVPGEDEKEGYGKNRLYLEKLARDMYPDNLTVRLPALYGKNIKKNFIYDYLNFIPSMLSKEKMSELLPREKSLAASYAQRWDGFWVLKEKPVGEDRQRLKKIFENLGFSALNFTDSRSVYQFYGLSRLAGDIDTALAADLKVVNLMCRPVSAGFLYSFITGGKVFDNPILAKPLFYDTRTAHAELFGGKDGYIEDRDTVCRKVKAFAESYEI